MSVSLRFYAPRFVGPAIRLVFGAVGVEATLALSVDLGDPVLSVNVLVDPVTVTGRGGGAWRDGDPLAQPARVAWSDLTPEGRAVTGSWVQGSTEVRKATAPWAQGLLLGRQFDHAWRDGAALGGRAGLPWRGTTPVPQFHVVAPWRQGVYREVLDALPWGAGVQRARTVEVLMQAARPLPRPHRAAWSDGARLHHHNREPWAVGLLVRSYGAPFPVVVVPPGHVCYTPSGVLRFVAPAATNGVLRFRCEGHATPPGATIVVPVRRAYMILNNVSLRRVTGDIELPAQSFSMTLDHASWTYGFSAGLPASAMQYLAPEDDGSPALLEATVNGETFRLLAEGRSRSRTFGRGDFSVRGRGRNAILDAPYAPVMQFTSTSSRTLQQLVQHVLTINGVSLGWDVDFGLAFDWLVPGGAWAAQGSFIAALNDIASAAGGYLQPHPTADTLRLLPLYPAAPWAWGDVTSDFVLPAAVMSQEDIEWLQKAAYNNVVVAGTTNGGVRVNVTRDGTAGDLSAPMVTHPLMTHVDAGRARGIAVLSDTGTQARVSLKMPVLSETGIIPPGKFISYVDGSTTRFGITRSVDVGVVDGQVWQNITVETHE